MVKNRIELIVSFPFLASVFAWYFRLGLPPDSPAQNPETLYRQRGFIAYVAGVALLVALLFFIDIPPLDWFLQNTFREF